MAQAVGGFSGSLEARFAQRLQETCWSSQDGHIAGDGQLVHLISDLDGVHTCTDCGKQFASNCGLAVHVAGVHGKGWHLLIV